MSSEERGRNKSTGGRLISSLRSRSRSRAASKSRASRSSSVQPPERGTTAELDEAKKRRAASRPARHPHESKTFKLPSSSSQKSRELVDLTKSMKKRSKSLSRSKSGTALRKTKSSSPPSSAKKWDSDIIDLVDQEDVLLDDLLYPGGKHQRRGKSPMSKPTSTNKGSGSPISVGRFPGNNPADADSDEEDSDEELDAQELLAQVKSRMEQQRLMEEAKELRKIIESKDAEIDQLTGQLRMAISTKCDLVIAHTELERLHEKDIRVKENYAESVRKHNLYLLEMRAEVEKEFMNELTQLAKKVEDTEERRKKDFEEKDLTIKLLEQKIYRMEKNAMQGSSARPDDDKVKFYKKRLGVVDQ